MKPIEVYALLSGRLRKTQSQVDALSAQTIGAAAEAYIQEHPEVLE